VAAISALSPLSSAPTEIHLEQVLLLFSLEGNLILQPNLVTHFALVVSIRVLASLQFTYLFICHAKLRIETSVHRRIPHYYVMNRLT